MRPATQRPFRIALFGNIANAQYQFAKILRMHTDIDAHLFVDFRDSGSMRPENDDPALASGYPPWIHLGDYLPSVVKVLPWRSALIHEVRNFDFLIASGQGPMIAQFADIPWAFYVTGSDLTRLPFPRRFWRRHSSWKSRVGSWVVGIWQRRAIRRANAVWSQPFQPFAKALFRLGVPPGRIAREYFPMAIDAGSISLHRIPDLPDAERLRLRDRFVVFHPSRIMIRADRAVRDAGQWKANDVLIRGFAQFVESNPDIPALLIMPDRSDWPDTAIARQLVNQLAVSDSVLWLQPPRKSGFTRSELLPYYKACDVVADDFGAGWFGAIALEALALERPLVTYVDQTAMVKLYPWHPIISAHSAQDVSNVLGNLARDPTERERIGRRGRKWIEAFHSGDAVGKRYAENLSIVTQRLGISDVVLAQPRHTMEETH